MLILELSKQECRSHCTQDNRCKSFTWAPLNSDSNHPGKTVFTIYNTDTLTKFWGPNQIMCKPSETPTYPVGWDQVGEINADYVSCGLEYCYLRYNKTTIEEYSSHCAQDNKYKSFTWDPLNGDSNHPGKTVCTIYNTDISTRFWRPNQIMCKPSETPTVNRLPYIGILIVVSLQRVGFDCVR